MIKDIEIENWRSIESLQIPLEPLTVLVGPNGVGKTAILNAIDFVLGSRWPGLNYLDVPRDFHSLDTSKAIRIRCSFEPNLNYTDSAGDDHEIGSLEYCCRPYKKAAGGKEVGDLHDDFYPLSPKGEKMMVVTERPQAGVKRKYGPLLRINTGLKDQARVLTIGDRRSVSYHASGRRGSALSILLASARKSFEKDVGGARSSFKEKYDAALEALRTQAVKDVEEAVGDTAKQMLGFLGKGAVQNLEIGFGFADPSNPFGSLSVLCKEGDLELPAELMGLGIQSAIVVGVFDALRKQNAQIGTIIIEEPEMYLHPQAQRFFHNLLVDMVDSGQCQVIYSSHSPVFADASRFESLRLLQKPTGGTTTVARVSQDSDLKYLEEQRQRQKLGQYMDPASGEVLFARRVLLVEGHGDYLAARIVAKKLNIDLDAESLSVIACGGKAAIPFFARLCRSLEIPAIILHDRDIQAGDSLTPKEIGENAKAKAQNDEIKSASAETTQIFLVDPSLESILGIGQSAADKPMRVVSALEPLKVEELPKVLVDAVQALNNEPSDGEDDVSLDLSEQIVD